MEFEAFGGAATIALLGSAVFALTARAWITLSRAQARHSPFRQSILPESAQRFRDELDLLDSKQSALLASALVFAVLFAFAWMAGGARLLAGADTWLLVIVAVILVAAVAWALYRLLRILVLRRRLAFRRFANIAVGQALQKVTGNLNRVFHDVPCGTGVIDHVLVGQKGVYAVFVIARRAGKHNKVRARDARLWFAPGRESLLLDEYAAISDQLARRCLKAIGSRVRVRTVLVVPGWDVEEQSSEEFLIVNERNLIMLRGWRDRSEYLMNEDVESLHEYLTDCSSRVPQPAAEGPEVRR